MKFFVLSLSLIIAFLVNKVFWFFVLFCFVFWGGYFLTVPHGILVPWLGIEPVSHVVEAQSLNHWTTREVPTLSHLLLLFIFFLLVFEYIILFSSGLESLCWKICCCLMGIPLYVTSLSFFPLLLIFKSLSLSFTFNSLIIMYLGVALLRFNIFGVLRCSRIWIFNLKSIFSDISVATLALLGYYCLKIPLFFFSV